MELEVEPSLDISVVLPAYNKAGALPGLIAELTSVLVSLGKRYEILAVDDGSTDDSIRVLQAAKTQEPNLRVICLRRNFGQSAALSAGFDRAQGRVVVTMDADGQNDPADIPALLAKMEEDDVDLVKGWRQNRKEPFLTRRLPSMLANLLISRTSGIPLHDRGCSLCAYRHDLVKQIKLYGEMHRFIPELASQIGAREVEVPVKDRKRKFGRTKYGLSRTLRVILDLLTVVFLSNYQGRPMQFLGLFGLSSSGLGVLIGGYLLTAKIINGIVRGPAGWEAYQIDRPLLLLAVLMVLLGVQFVVMGLLGEMIARTYYEAQGKKTYIVRKVF